MNSKKENLWSKVSTFLVFAGPATFSFLAVVIVPFLYGVYLTFTSWDGVSSNKPFVGLKNYAAVLDVSVSYMAEVERGRTGISVKMLIKICKVLGLSADYVLFGETRTDDELRVDRIRRIDERYLPLLDGVITELLALH